MTMHMCAICEWVYDEAEGDPQNGIAPGTPWDQVPDTWHCPQCGIDKSAFDLLDL